MAASAKGIIKFHGRKINTEEALSMQLYFFSENVPLPDLTQFCLPEPSVGKQHVRIRAARQQDTN